MNLVRSQRRNEFLAAMFVPEPVRQGLFALYALDIELEHISHLVKEEMIGHIRYAWWAETIEGLANNPINANKHEVLQALTQAGWTADLLLPIVAEYRDNFPEAPKNISGVLQNSAKQFIQKHAPQALQKWQKATDKITAHQQKYAGRYYSWLLFKLLFV